MTSQDDNGDDLSRHWHWPTYYNVPSPLGIHSARLAPRRGLIHHLACNYANHNFFTLRVGYMRSYKDIGKRERESDRFFIKRTNGHELFYIYIFGSSSRPAPDAVAVSEEEKDGTRRPLLNLVYTHKKSPSSSSDPATCWIHYTSSSRTIIF